MPVPDEYPCIRPVEAIPDPQNRRIVLRDPTHLAAGILVVGEAEFTLITLLDGRRRRVDIQADYARRYGRILLSSELDDLLETLAASGYLAGDGFETYYAKLADEYRRAHYRPLRDPDGFGAPATSLSHYLDRALMGEVPTTGATSEPVGLVVPHLDYQRGMPCYAAGYRRVMGVPPRRVVILGTNHFGRSRSVVATEKDFQTPQGLVRTDRVFLGRLQAELGGTLLPYELDHLREHSIELQAIWAHHLFGDEVRIVPVLCPDPTGRNGTAPGDPGGVDLRQFALALGYLLERDPLPTLVVASADLSHVGRYFGDRRSLDTAVLQKIRESDDTGLALVERGEAEAFRVYMAGTGNPTRWCSIGCLYALLVALGEGVRAERLRYHQAVTHELDNAVTCAAFAFCR